MSLDVHPRSRPHLANPALPLFITEGSRKADALISAGARAVVGVIGVWNWRGRNGDDGLALLADWEWVALKEGRQVFVAYDSDVMVKEPVHRAMGRMGVALRRTGASVAYCYLPAGAGGVKRGADDFLAGGGRLEEIVALAAPHLREPVSSLSVEGCGGPEPRAPVHKPPGRAHEPDVLARFARDIRRLGHVGEERACRLIYLCATSRLLPKIVSCVLKGPSAAGKSATVDRVLSLFPAGGGLPALGDERALAPRPPRGRWSRCPRPHDRPGGASCPSQRSCADCWIRQNSSRRVRGKGHSRTCRWRAYARESLSCPLGSSRELLAQPAGF
jgi:hypothetical protein